MVCRAHGEKMEDLSDSVLVHIHTGIQWESVTQGPPSPTSSPSHSLSSRLNCLLFLAGGHINPAVSFAMCAFGRMEWFRFPFYVGAQFLGAFAGAATVFGIYYGEY